MITVYIAINGVTIMARSATKTLIETPKGYVYRCDEGSKIIHNREDGAVALAVKMLKTIKEIDSHEQKEEMFKCSK